MTYTRCGEVEQDSEESFSRVHTPSLGAHLLRNPNSLQKAAPCQSRTCHLVTSSVGGARNAENVSCPRVMIDAISAARSRGRGQSTSHLVAQGRMARRHMESEWAAQLTTTGASYPSGGGRTLYPLLLEDVPHAQVGLQRLLRRPDRPRLKTRDRRSVGDENHQSPGHTERRGAEFETNASSAGGLLLRRTHVARLPGL